MGGERFVAIGAVEGFAAVDSQVCLQSIARIKGFFLAVFLACAAAERFVFGVDSDVDFQRVGSEERFATTFLSALVTVVAVVGLQVGFQVSNCAVRAITLLKVAAIARRISLEREKFRTLLKRSRRRDNLIRHLP